MKTGVYRFDVLPYGGESWVTVRSGYGEATGKGPAVRVNSGQQVRFSNDQTLQHTAMSAPAPDGFDDWAQVRDKRLADSLSARYVSPGVIGYQDLDAYGTWQTTPDLRRDLGADLGARGLGALSLRTLGVDRALGLDLGGRRSLGLRSLPLWPLGLVERRMGLGSWTARLLESLLCSGAGGLDWRPGLRRRLRLGWGWDLVSASALAGSRWAGVRPIIRAIADGDTAAGTTAEAG